MDIRVEDNVENIFQFEDMRNRAHGFDHGYSEYYNKLFDENKIVIVSAYIDDQLAGAAYLTLFDDRTCNIDQLFVEPKYQFSDYHVGSSLLKFVEQNINSIKEYHDMRIRRILISPSSETSEKIYRDQGYEDTRLDGTLYKRVR